MPAWPPSGWTAVIVRRCWVSSDTTTDFPVGSRVRVSADADDVYFGGEIEGVVIEMGFAVQDTYMEEERVHVKSLGGAMPGLKQYVRPHDLTLITDE